MKKNIQRLVSIVLVFAIIMVNTTPVQAASQKSLKSKLAQTTKEPIRKFYYQDLNGDGKKEAIGITAKQKDIYGYYRAKIWYVSNSRCYMMQQCEFSLYDGTPRFYKLNKTKMFCCAEGAGGSGSITYAWTFNKNGAKKVKNVMYGIRQIKGNEFVIIDSRFDASTDGSGHTWNSYFSKWNGKKLVEYGGLKISKEQLKKAKNGAKILKEVKKYGKVKSIYYRANGMIFINLSDGRSNRNVALKLKKGKVTYYDYGDGGSTALEKATQAGIIHKSITSCVKYPKKFPLK